jgi:hypothetical protein
VTHTSRSSRATRSEGRQGRLDRRTTSVQRMAPFVPVETARGSALCPCPDGACFHPLNASAAVSSRAIAPAAMDVIAIPRVTAEFVDRAVHSTPRARATTPPTKPRGTPTRNATESMSPTFCPSIAGSSAPTTPATPARSAVRHHQRGTACTGKRGPGGVGGSGGGHACCSGAGSRKPPALTVSRDAIADHLRCSHCASQNQRSTRVQGQRNRCPSKRRVRYSGRSALGRVHRARKDLR